jgi:hypothetical protein
MVKKRGDPSWWRPGMYRYAVCSLQTIPLLLLRGRSSTIPPIPSTHLSHYEHRFTLYGLPSLYSTQQYGTIVHSLFFEARHLWVFLYIFYILEIITGQTGFRLVVNFCLEGEGFKSQLIDSMIRSFVPLVREVVRKS